MVSRQTSEFLHRMCIRKLARENCIPWLENSHASGYQAPELKWTSSGPPSRVPGTIEPLTQQIRPGVEWLPPEPGKDPGKTYNARTWILPNVPRSKDSRLRCDSVSLNSLGSWPKNQGWLTGPKSKNKPQVRYQVSSSKCNEKRALRKATKRSWVIALINLRCLGMKKEGATHPQTHSFIHASCLSFVVVTSLFCCFRQP